MILTQNIHPTRLFGPTRLIGTWEYLDTILKALHSRLKQSLEKFEKLRIVPFL